MPYLTCESCGLISFAVRNRRESVDCPGCGARLNGPGEVRDSRLRFRAGISGTLGLAREMLGMDLAMVSEIAGDQEVARHVSGEWPSLGPLEGRAIPLKETFCARLLEGTLTSIVRDARGDDRVSDLGMVKALGVGSWIGVPMQTADARLYVLCCLAREARPALQERDVFALAALGETLVDQLERGSRHT